MKMSLECLLTRMVRLKSRKGSFRWAAIGPEYYKNQNIKGHNLINYYKEMAMMQPSAVLSGSPSLPITLCKESIELISH